MSYTGVCKDGLAHGKGIAKGLDEYNGSFKKGLPDGYGEYMWSNGDTYKGRWKAGKRSGQGMLFTAEDKKVINAIWDDDEIKKVVEKQYKVLNAASLSFISIKKDPTLLDGYIAVGFDIPRGHDFFNTLDIEHSSGVLIKNNGSLLFKEVSFPFKAEISFMITGTSFVIHKSCIAEFEIYENEGWSVVIKE